MGAGKSPWTGATLLILAAGFASGPAGPAAGQEYQVDLGRERVVRFLSDAPLEDFEGITDRIDGFLLLPGGGLGADTDLSASKFHFEVDLGSLDTGIGLRNRHMRDNYLETEDFPYASFSGRVVLIEENPSGGHRTVSVGVFTVHGIEREREIECTADGADERFRVRCAFQVTLTDHDIPIPKLMFMKIDEVMELTLDFFLTPVTDGKGR